MRKSAGILQSVGFKGLGVKRKMIKGRLELSSLLSLPLFICVK